MTHKNGRATLLIVSLGVLLVLGGFGRASAAPGLLDGQKFTVETGEKGKEKGEVEDLVFKDGTFRSAGCDIYGFKEAPYTATATGEAIKFEVVTHSEIEGKMTWKGTVTGKKIEGTALWEKPGQASIDHWFRGSLKN